MNNNSHFFDIFKFSSIKLKEYNYKLENRNKLRIKINILSINRKKNIYFNEIKHCREIKLQSMCVHKLFKN